MKHDTTFQDGIGAALTALHCMLNTALGDVQTACTHIRRGEQNAAVGSVLTLEDVLEQATALYRAVIAMHRFKQ